MDGDGNSVKGLWNPAQQEWLPTDPADTAGTPLTVKVGQDSCPVQVGQELSERLRLTRCPPLEDVNAHFEALFLPSATYPDRPATGSWVYTGSWGPYDPSCGDFCYRIVGSTNAEAAGLLDYEPVRPERHVLQVSDRRRHDMERPHGNREHIECYAPAP